VGIGSLVFAAAACGSSNTGAGDDGGTGSGCASGTDADGDGYGDGCEAGPDCADWDPDIHENCCDDGVYQGCACEPGVDMAVSCYEADPATAGTAACIKGMRSCDPVSSVWGACGGQVIPEQEVCNSLDDDCDGDTDEGVLSMCGNCTPGCDSQGIDMDPFPFPDDNPDVDVDGVGLDPNGDLVLDSSTIENHFLWIANDREGTVSKIDTRTGREVGRYASVTHVTVVDEANGATFSNWNTDANGNGYADNRPSRTAVDFKSDVWVANRAHDGGNNQPTATKIYNVLDDCVDKDMSGAISTSSDVNDDGVINVNDPLEFFAEADECIAFTVVVGAANGIARALAIDQGIEPGDPGNAWIGMNGEQAFYQLDGRTGALVQRVPPTGQISVRPYGAAIDSQGRLFAPDHCCESSNGTMVEINTVSNPATIEGYPAFPNFTGADTRRGTYGIVIDQDDKVWLAGYPAGGVHAYDQATQMWSEVQIAGAFGAGWGTRGLGIDTHGNVWAALHQGGTGGRLARIDTGTLMSTGLWDINGTVPVGAGVDFDGDVWTVNQSTSNASRLHIDQALLEPAMHPMTGNSVDVFPVGPNPYTYSDFTGLGLRTITRPSGDYVIPFQGGIPRCLRTPWSRSGSVLATISPPSTRSRSSARGPRPRPTSRCRPAPCPRACTCSSPCA
jgi:hypothetical protein